MEFRATVRFWHEDRGSGLAVVDAPGEVIAALGGLRQRRVQGTINGVPYTSSVAPAGAGRLALTVSKAMLRAAGAAVGDEVVVAVEV
jgi:hypothetical protein